MEETYPNIPSGPAPDPDIPEPEPEPELIIQFNFLYKNEGDAEWREYQPTANDVQIVDGQVTITANDFKKIEGFSNIKEVQLPNKLNNGSEVVDIITIGYQAFNNCSGLSHVIILDGITKIDQAAFSNCSNLISVEIPDSVVNISKSAFQSTLLYDNQADGLIVFGKTAYGIKGQTPSVVEIPDGIMHINANAFSGHNELTTILLPDTVTTIGRSAFDACTSLVLDNIPSLPINVTTIEQAAFASCASLTSVIIPNKVTTIGVEAFVGCTQLELVMFGNNVKNIGQRAFQSCYKLKTLIIPDSVTTIDNDAFQYCNNLTNVIILANGGNSEIVKQMIITAINRSTISDSIVWDVPVNVSNGKVLYKTTTSINWIEDDAQVENGKFTGFLQIKSAAKILLPVADIDGNTITSIGQRSFYSFSSRLKYLAIPDNILSIEDETFLSCRSIKTILMTGKTMNYIQEMTNYPWSLPSNCQIICSDGIITI